MDWARFQDGAVPHPQIEGADGAGWCLIATETGQRGKAQPLRVLQFGPIADQKDSGYLPNVFNLNGLLLLSNLALYQ